MRRKQAISSYSKDDMIYSKSILRNKLFRWLLEERYEGKIWIRYNFEIAKLPQKLTLLAEMEESSEFVVEE